MKKQNLQDLRLHSSEPRIPLQKYAEELEKLGSPVSNKFQRCSPSFRKKIYNIVKKCDVIGYKVEEEEKDEVPARLLKSQSNFKDFMSNSIVSIEISNENTMNSSSNNNFDFTFEKNKKMFISDSNFNKITAVTEQSITNSEILQNNTNYTLPLDTIKIDKKKDSLSEESENEDNNKDDIMINRDSPEIRKNSDLQMRKSLKDELSFYNEENIFEGFSNNV